MKKTYKKPVVYIETLKLTNSIAACNAGGTHQFSDARSCSYVEEVETPLFYDVISGCASLVPEGLGIMVMYVMTYQMIQEVFCL